MHLQFSHTVTETKKTGRVTQKMDIEVNYDPEQDTFDVKKVDLFIDGNFVGEISKLLHKAEGNPLRCMCEEIPWADIYRDTHQDEIIDEPFEVVEPEFTTDDLFEQIAKLTRDHNTIFYGIKVNNAAKK